MSEATTKAHDTKTPHILILDGKASRHDWRMMAVGYAACALVPGPNWATATQEEIVEITQRQTDISAQLERDGEITVDGHTAHLYPLTMPPDYWAGEDRDDYRGGWNEHGGGVEIVGLIIDEPEDGNEWTAKLTALGYEVKSTLEEVPDIGDLMSLDLSEWRPLPPAGDGWMLWSAFQDEDQDDLIAQWVRPAVRPVA
ncbi:MAG: hypothetical protein VR70_10305 [Rhodospirillaceae bacterium BRH_c57]|nr:MAG: hypothetical protein VR70_10305 [Rhodospirillaceae bacterium BRH_c57]